MTDHLIERADEAATLAAGKRVLVKRRAFAHPYYWAAWVLWGLAD